MSYAELLCDFFFFKLHATLMVCLKANFLIQNTIVLSHEIRVNFMYITMSLFVESITHVILKHICQPTPLHFTFC